MHDPVVLRLAPPTHRRPSASPPLAPASCASPRRIAASAARNAGCCASRRYPGCRISSRRPAPAATCTRDQSASISSATTIGRLVRTPVPISERLVMMVTRPDGSIATKTCGSLTVPPGILSAPVAQSAHRLARQQADANHQRARGDQALAARSGGSHWRLPTGLRMRRCFEHVGHGSHSRRGEAHRFGDALIAAAATDIAGHRREDVVARSASALLASKAAACMICPA